MKSKKTYQILKWGISVFTLMFIVYVFQFNIQLINTSDDEKSVYSYTLEEEDGSTEEVQADILYFSESHFKNQFAKIELLDVALPMNFHFLNVYFDVDSEVLLPPPKI